MGKLLAHTSLEPRGCAACAFRCVCGGLEQQQAFYGCFSCSGSCDRTKPPCDWVCPRKPDFWRDWAEVGGLNPVQRRELPAIPTELPLYVPMVRHPYSRTEPLPTHFVAFNTFEVLDAQCRARDSRPSDLRDRFLVDPGARALLVSVDKDTHIEKFWAEYDREKLAALSRLGIAAITTPNFSFFDDAPRLHNVRNLWRIRRCAEDMADAGLHPVLHVNALGREDWRMWARVLKENPAVRHVCKEFQTGLKDPALAGDALEGLRRLQEEAGRKLHPIVVGGLRVAGRLSAHFERFTVVDSVPFFLAMHRRRIARSGMSTVRVDNPTEMTEPLDQLLQDNIREYHRLVALSVAGTAEVPDVLDVDEGEAIECNDGEA